MHGNVWEWCSDWFGDYSDEVAIDPVGPSKGRDRVCRGGSWVPHGWHCRSRLSKFRLIRIIFPRFLDFSPD